MDFDFSVSKTSWNEPWQCLILNNSNMFLVLLLFPGCQVSGGGKKPWQQKGSGRARQGSIRAPQWRGGGIVHGPVPRSHAFDLPRKVRPAGDCCCFGSSNIVTRVLFKWDWGL